MTKIKIEGLVNEEQTMDFAALTALEGQVEDVSRLVPGREGGAVMLSSVLSCVGVAAGATHISVIASDGSFAASVPLDAVRDAVLLYRHGDAELPASSGGPVRLLIPDAARCRSAEVDTCANVKFVGTLRVSAGPGEDTRPVSPTSHAGLHRKPGHEHLD
jgi:DMSO/TMAO reductase YedYZ molybdopterin-dependent catalytic subunit